MKLMFAQFDTRFLYRDCQDDIAVDYYEMIFDVHGQDGYVKHEPFWEIPLWIAEACATLREHEKMLHIIDDVEAAVARIRLERPGYVLFGVLDLNKEHVRDIIANMPEQQFIVGGYIDFEYLDGLENATIMDSMQELAEYLGEDYHYGLDYCLFAGYYTIPRLRLSKGCWNRCKFCTVENRVEAVSDYEVHKQVEAYKRLRFQLVYLDDKTFGQALNYKLLADVYEYIKSYNPEFRGFVVQTTTAMLGNKEFVEDLASLHVFACEVGVETYNDDILASLWKPQNTGNIDSAIDNLEEAGINIIPNFIIGLPGETEETYANTLGFIEENRHRFYFMNIYSLAVYKTTELGKELEGAESADYSELDVHKTFHTKEQRKAAVAFYERIYRIGIEILSTRMEKQEKITAEETTWMTK